MTHSRPSKEQLKAASGQTTPDVIAPGLAVLFCGINPSLYSAVVRHHFARPGNRFWPALCESGFTPRLLRPWEEAELLGYGYGITNVYERATATAAEVSKEEIRAGGQRLCEKVLTYEPRVLAVLGIGAYRTAFDRPRAVFGLQEEKIGTSRVWVLPNPSGLNAHFQLPELAAAFRELRHFAERLA
jgi:double-stranded uracil-DNA glycosylase